MQKKEFNLIKKIIKKASNVYIMGHKGIDLDAFGSALGIYCYASHLKKEANIIIDDKKLESSVKKAVLEFKEKINIIKSSDIDENYNDDSLLVIVDTNKQILLQNPKLLDKFNNVIVIDHHALSDTSISNDNTLMFVDTEHSSACEIITQMLINDNYYIDSEIATMILSGIILDTNNFTLKTDMDTYYSAYYLSKCGADSKKVQYLLKQDIKEYINRQKVITDVEVIKNIAISRGLQTQIYRREDLAKIADTVLLFSNIEASFVVGKIDGGIGISARSMGNIDVGKILERFGGGGDNHEAATKITDKSLNEVFDLILKESKKK